MTKAVKGVGAAMGTVLGVAFGAVVLVGIGKWASDVYVSPQEQEVRVRAKLASVGFTKIVLRGVTDQWEVCGDYARRFAAADSSGDVVMGLVCCVEDECQVRH